MTGQDGVVRLVETITKAEKILADHDAQIERLRLGGGNLVEIEILERSALILRSSVDLAMYVLSQSRGRLS